MIKLIATDMDGTLLNNRRELPDGLFSFIEELERQGVLFVVASARNYFNLSRIFQQIDDKIGYICDNGAYAQVKGETLVQKALPQSEMKHLVSFCETIPDVHCVLCAKNAVYYSDMPSFEKDLGFTMQFNATKVSCLQEVEDDVFRIGIEDLKNPLYHSIPLIEKKFPNQLNIVATDSTSVDIMVSGVSKGSALELLQKKLNIKAEETMVFGDYYNDVGMFDKAYYSYAMANALDEVKQKARFIAKSNEENGVLSAIQEHLHI